MFHPLAGEVHPGAHLDHADDVPPVATFHHFLHLLPELCRPFQHALVRIAPARVRKERQPNLVVLGVRPPCQRAAKED